MQPDEKQNYWKKENQSDSISGSYQPTPESSSSTPNETPTGQAPAIDNTTETKNGTQTIDSASFQHAEPVQWVAKEYIDADRNWLWFVIFFIVVIGLIALDIFFMKAYTFSALAIVMAVALIIYIKRPPRDIKYTLSADQGLYIGEKLQHFSEFKSFGVVNDRDHHFILLIPTKRFRPGVSVYFPDEVGEKIVDILGSRLPMENMKLDIIDIIVRKLRL